MRTITQKQVEEDEALRRFGINPTRPIIPQLPLRRLYCSSIVVLIIYLCTPDPSRTYTPCPHHGCCVHDYPSASCTPSCHARTNRCSIRTPGGSVGIRV